MARRATKRTDRPGAEARARRAARTGRSWGSILRGLVRLFAPPLLSALLLTLAFPPAEVSWLAYVALVPLLVTALRAGSRGDAFWSALAAGTVFFAINLYWVQPITTAGYLAVLPYLALFWAVWALLMRWVGRRLRVPLAVAAPVAWVALEWGRGWFLTGLPWLYVGHTQYENLVLIQTADALGAYGPSALCLATTGLLAGVLVRPIVVPGGGDGASPSRDRKVAGDGATSRERERAVERTRNTERGMRNDQRNDRGSRRDSSVASLPQNDRTGANGRGASSRPRPSGALLANLLVVVLAWAGTVGYGLYRLGQEATRPGPVVASVQTNVPQEIKLKARLEQIERLEERLMREQLDLTDRALARAAERGREVDLVVWPETMVPGIMNREYLEADIDRLIRDDGLRRIFRYLRNRSRGYWRQIAEKARRADVPILFGAHAVELQGAYRLPGGGFMTRGPRRNTAFLLSPASEPYKADHRYAKAHLVPFGEYVPFRESWPWLHERLQAFTPYDYDHSLTPGSHHQEPFVIGFDGREARFQVAICYEDAMAYRIREMVRADGGMRNAERNGNDSRRDPSVASLPQNDIENRRPRKAVDFIVNISNDGWFNGSWELDQHLNLCVFRAVENRVPVVRSVNTGISALIQSTGRIDRVVRRNGDRRNVAGCIVGGLDLDDRLSPYTRHGDAFAAGCILATVGLMVAAGVGRFRARRAAAAPGKEQTT